MKWNEAMGILEQCERELRKVVAEAAGEGDYVSVLRIADLAKAVKALAEEGRSTVPSIAATRTNADIPRPTSTGKANDRKSRSSIENYPKFFRRGDELVKVGWSKKERKEYHHRAPRAAIEATASTIRKIVGNGKLFNGDALLPLNGQNGTRIPDYQVYVSLAWLAHLGVLDQNGRRGGYSLAAEKQIESTIVAEWSGLAEWRG